METCRTSSTRGHWILFATILASGMAFLDGTVVTVALPELQRYFNADLMGLQWIVDAYALSLAALILTAGSLGDIFGQRRVFVSGIVLFVLFSLLCGLAQSMLQLIIARGLQGIGAALMIPGSLAIINSCFEENNRGQAIGLWAGFSGGLAAMGPFLGGWLTEFLSWRYIFFINLPLGILAILITTRYIPLINPQTNKRIDWWGTWWIVVGLVALSYALIEGPRFGWSSTIIVSCGVIGVAGLLLFLRVQTTSKQPMIDAAIFKNRHVIVANVITFCLYFGLNGLIFFIVLNFQQLQHYSPVDAGLALLPPIVLITFLSGVGGVIVDKYGPRLPLTFGAFIIMASMIMLMLPHTHASYWVDFLPGLILFGLGMSLVIAPVTKSALLVEPQYAGTASGINNAVARVAALLAVAMLGAMVITFFSQYLASQLSISTLSAPQQHAVMAQANKLGGIKIPTDFTPLDRAFTKQLIEHGFVLSYRLVMGVCAALACISTVISWLYMDD